MMRKMMTQCCGKEGMPKFEMMKAFMVQQGKKAFSDDDLDRMRQFYSQMEKPDANCEAKMKRMMERCGCKCH